MRPNDRPTTEKQEEGLSDINLSELINIILTHRKIIGILVGTTFVLSIIVSLLLPKMYIATARILPPQENNTGIVSLISNADNPLSGLASSLVDSQTPASLYVGILKSRSVADELILKFDLKELYDKKYIEDVYTKLSDRSHIKFSKKDQIIIVSVKDRNPQRAADLANAYVEMLDKKNRILNITQGRRKRQFLEGRLKEVRNDLENAEIELRAFQEKYNLIAIDEQAKVSIDGAAKIKSQIIVAQTELEVLKQFGTEKQIEAVMLKTKIEELTKQLEAIERGEQPDADNQRSFQNGKKSDFYIAFADLPRLGMQLMRLTREAKIQEKLFELLTAQYEIAQIEEAKDVDTIQVIDSAVPPEKKISPKRSMIVIISTLLSLLISFFVIICTTYKKHIKKIF
jgi:tyrosine-protein kinase Etk/Wzc